MSKPRITISLPCFGRPARTIRAIDSVLAQNTNNYELLITGDHCPYFSQADFSRLIDKYQFLCEELGNRLVCNNNQVHSGSWGYQIRNQHIKDATGTYFMFMGSDDVLHHNHLANELKYIENTDLDWIYFDTWVEPNCAPRNAQLQPGMIGHSELIIKTEFLQRMPPHTDRYGHDWDLVNNMMAATGKYKKAVGAPQTYIVKSIPGKEEHGID